MKRNNIILFVFTLCIFCLCSCGLESDLEKEGNKFEEPPSEKIEMIKDSSDYVGAEWTIEELTSHLTDLGFTNIRSVSCKPDADNYQDNIFEVSIERNFLKTGSWEAGERFNVDAEISIYYNESPLLTSENCPLLVKVLTGKEISYWNFCNQYDGHYVEFDAYVTNHSTYDGGTSHIIEVTGGDYDGVSEIKPYVDECFDGLIIRIGDRKWGNEINKNVEPGDNVTVRGIVDASWAKYFKRLYVEAMYMDIR